MRFVVFFTILLGASVVDAQDVEQAYQHVWEANIQNLQRPPQSPEWFSTLINRSGDQYDAAMISTLAAAMNVWVLDPGPEEGVVCMDIIDRVSQRPAGVGGLTASVYFAAAQASEIIGQSDKTMALLREALDVCGTQPAPGAEQVTVNVVANVWLGRLAYDTGLVDEAINAYTLAAEAVGPSQPGLQDIRAWCMLYTGEIQAARGDKEAALNALAQVDAIMTNSVRTELAHLQSEWAKRLTEEITNGSSGIVTPTKSYLPAGVAAEMQGKLNGSSLKPLNGVFHDTDRNGLLLTAIENGIPRCQSVINRELGQVRLGELHVKAERWMEAESVYRTLYEAGSFLAPFAGLQLAECLAKLNRGTDAAAIYKDLLERWPTYSTVVAAECKRKYAETKDAAWQSVAAASTAPLQDAPVTQAAPSPPSHEQSQAASKHGKAARAVPQPAEESSAEEPKSISNTLYYVGATGVGGIVGVACAVLFMRRRKWFRANSQQE